MIFPGVGAGERTKLDEEQQLLCSYCLQPFCSQKSPPLQRLSRPGLGKGQTLRHRLEGDSFASHFDVDEEGGR